MAQVGRPPAIDKLTLQELEGAFMDGASDKVACFLAKISEATLYNYQNEHPEFLERKKALKNQVKFQAKKVIRKAIENGDLDTSKWFAERKLKDEGFSTRQEITGAGGKDLPTPILGYEIQENDSDNTNNTAK